MPKEEDYRQKAIEEYGTFCQKCGREEEILVHHRDGDRTNNNLANLIPLCSVCHGKVHGRSEEFPRLVQGLGYQPRSDNRSTLQASDTLLDALHDRKNRCESYEDVIWSLLGQVEGK